MSGAAAEAPGVSVVVCCYNSTPRLRPTLAHLLAQRVPDGLPWEVVVVDNASTDGTATFAAGEWTADAPAPLRVVQEPQPGLSHARRRGFAEARHPFVSFIDDDNWVAPDWVAMVAEILASNPAAGACGGLNEGVYETPPPAWFGRYQGHLAIGPQAPAAGDLTNTKGILWGAGMSVRKAAWESLNAAGFRFYMGDRVGDSLLAGGDCELCFGLRLAGWRLLYDPRLRLKHFMSSGRLTWDYIVRLNRAFGQTAAWAEVYNELFTGDRKGWTWQMLELVGLIARHPVKFVGARLGGYVGDHHVALQEMCLGRMHGLWTSRRPLAEQRRVLRAMRWPS